MRKLILIISDSENINMIFRGVLKADYDIETANTPEEAFEIMERVTPNLVVTTLRHRKSSCFDFLGKLQDKTDKQNPVPSVIITTTITPDVLTKANQFLVSDFFKLPVEPLDFCDKIYDILLKYAPSYERLDPLTGLHKKQFADEQIAELLDSGKKGALFLIGVDKYKFASSKVSETALKTCSDVLMEINGRNAVTSVTSDGFILFVPKLSMRSEIEEYGANILKAMLEKAPEQIFISVGMAVSERHGSNYSDLYQACDLGLGLARQNGKNQCRFYKW